MGQQNSTGKKSAGQKNDNEKIDNLYQIFLKSAGVTTDSRNVPQGSIFFALKGDNFDGNSFVAAALEAGAAYAVTDDPALFESLCKKASSASSSETFAIEQNKNIAGENSFEEIVERLILTDDALITLQQLAAHHRRNLGIPIVALTGTNGKTTTKELITVVLSTEFNVASTSGNLNNHIGVPLTILKMKSDTELGVVEMGASAPGEIATLVAITDPDVALITNVGKAHLLGFGSFDGVKRAKGELYDYMEKREGVVLYNHDNEHLCRMVAERNLREAIPYGINYNEAEILPLSEEKPLLRIRLKQGPIISSILVGGYNADNIMAAVAVGEYFGIAPELSAKAIGEYTPQNNRSQLIKRGGNTLIVDAYNANPTSMRAALENFASMELPCKNLILGDMLELGDDSQSEHTAILRLIATLSGIEKCLFVGSEFRKSYDAAKGEKEGLRIVLKDVSFFDNSSQLHDFLTKERSSGKSFLIKGSRGTRLEAVLPAFPESV